MPAPPVIVVRDLVKRFRAPGAATAFVALTLPSLEVCGGECVAVIGPSGSGKTTLFHCVTGTLLASSGRVKLYGHDVTHMPEHRRTKLGMGRTFQNVGLVKGGTSKNTVPASAECAR